MLTGQTASLRIIRTPVLLVWSLFTMACGCSRPQDRERLNVAAAANLTGVMDEIVTAFENHTRIKAVVSYGSTAQLSQQIESGGPFDVFAAADLEHVEALIRKGKLQPASRAVYARGQLVLWIPKGNDHVQTIQDLIKPQVRFIAIAQPNLAPYGRAAVETLQATGIWPRVESKVAYANSISMARQYAAFGNADAAFTALSLVLKDGGTVIKVDQKLYKPLDQAVAISASTSHPDSAKQFTAFLLGVGGRSILSNGGYVLP